MHVRFRVLVKKLVGYITMANRGLGNRGAGVVEHGRAEKEESRQVSVREVPTILYEASCDNCRMVFRGGDEDASLWLDQYILAEVLEDNDWAVGEDGRCVCPHCYPPEQGNVTLRELGAKHRHGTGKASSVG